MLFKFCIYTVGQLKLRMKRAKGCQGFCRVGCGMVVTKDCQNVDLKKQNLPTDLHWLEVG